MAAALIAVVPGYTSHSIAGLYDNEGIAIFFMLLTCYIWLKAIRTGSLAWSAACAAAYFALAASWGGYVFLANLIPLHVLALLLTGHFDHRVYIAYSTFYILGTVLVMQIPLIGIQPMYSGEHMGSLGVFGLVQVALLTRLGAGLGADDQRLLRRALLVLSAGIAVAFLVYSVIHGRVAPWTGRYVV